MRALEWDGLFTHHREIIERTFRQQRAGEQVMLVADLDGRPIAQIWIDVRAAAVRGAGVLWAVRVHPDYQRRGIGTEMMRAAERLLRDRDFAAAELVAEEAETRAWRFYERLGYRVMRRVRQSYSYTTPAGERFEHDLDVLEMRKALLRPCPPR